MLGLVNRQINEKDRRYVVISLSDQGRKIFDEIENRYNAYIGRVLEMLPSEDRDTIIDSIGAFADAVAKLEARKTCCAEGAKQ